MVRTVATKKQTKNTENIVIIPTVLANNKEEFDEKLARLLPTSKTVQIDFMDGQFVPSKGVDIEDIPDLRRWAAWTFEAHLMMYHPETWFEQAAEKGFKRVIFHYEAVEDKNIESLAQQIRDLGMVPVLAINPETKPSRVLKYRRYVDGILFLGVHPGFNGAPYVTNTPQRVQELIEEKNKLDAKEKRTTRNKNNKSSQKEFFVQIDGGMKPETIAGVVQAGATRINSGSFVSNAPDPALALSTLYVAANAPAPSIEKTTASNIPPVPKRRSIRESLNRIKDTLSTAKENLKKKATKKTVVVGAQNKKSRKKK